MNAPLFKQYQNSSDLISLAEEKDLLSLEQVNQRIAELTRSLRSNEIIFQSEIQDEIENEIQSEIDFYKMQIEEWDGEEHDGEEHEDEVESALDRAALIQNYHNPSLYISILEARTIISDLSYDLERTNPYYRRFKHSLSKEEEIKYYETAILQTHQTYKEDPQSIYGYSLRPRTPSDKEEKIDSLEKKINGVENVVYQLIGGLYNQRTQSDIIDAHLCCLSGNKYRGTVDEDTICPTTRQGDQHEEEIKLLKRQVSKLEDTVALLIRIIKEN